MIRIDDMVHGRTEIEDRAARFADQAGLSGRPGVRFAACFSETIDWLALFFAVRAAGGSLLPLHPSTPPVAARRMAREGAAASCSSTA